ncbi:S-adenosylmethionine-diacylgycerolhomoserine-N-methlytransferase [Sphingomonas sp. YR710]|jgi:S-adenosylmethionine-diacylgycerolhomoserine-N-methlytransferase|uniref:class I SAM-dependent methyltransferase n=1 Tax=Sphingomonas sp. YR710 TaxID=1882773 RepID=UPI0008890062|nr:class I SAM-dependent methyltransferase [Sphingomonas sp. YR710]SDC97665.1 S-adenosylmethionine-diacylgycerolhomoserine-N-methlytransferase [Sphingomonas sp. YR710]
MITARRVGDAGDHMDRIYRRQRHIYDVTRKYYLLGRDAMIRDLAPPANGTVLEAGCGTGRNLIRAAQLYPQARFFGLDVSRAMLETARAHVAQAGLAGRITLAEGDATDFDPVALFGQQWFDRIFLSYTLSMIPDWIGVLDHVAHMIGADGRLHLVDFGQQERLPAPFRSALFAWLRKFDVTPRPYLQEAAQALAVHERLTLRWQAKYRGYAWSAQLER